MEAVTLVDEYKQAGAYAVQLPNFGARHSSGVFLHFESRQLYSDKENVVGQVWSCFRTLIKLKTTDVFCTVRNSYKVGLHRFNAHNGLLFPSSLSIIVCCGLFLDFSCGIGGQTPLTGKS
jgi:hypothetical protein